MRGLKFSALLNTFHQIIGASVSLLVVISLLTSCSFTRAQATPQPFNAPTYQPPVANAQTGVTATQANTGTTNGAAAQPAAPAQAATPTQAGAANAAPTAAPVQAAPAVTATAVAQAPAAPAQADTGNALTGYSAEIVADQQVPVVAQVNGQVLVLKVDVGSNVKSGDVLVQIDSTTLEAQHAQALAGLQAAKSQLDLLKTPATDQDLAAARAGLAAAGAAYNRAVNGPTDEEKRQALAQLKSAQAAVTVAQAGYNLVKGNPAIGALPQSLQLQQATLGYEAAQATYDKIMKGATADVIAGAAAQVANARAALQRLQDGAKAPQIQAAEAQVHNAENALYLAQLQLNRATVTAPIDGVVSRVSTAVGSQAAPGTPLVTLLSHTVKINVAVEEARLSQLKVGQKAIIHATAYPDRTFEGTIAIIAPEVDPNTRTAQVTIRPTGNANVLAPGMSATVELPVQ
ncbi:MAG: efflux RND transporter periplasmic adaptor subunit [Caldilineaceae bacterium]